MTDGPDSSRLPVLADGAADRSVFSLEMGPDGVRLRLRGAALGDWLSVRELVLSVPYPPRPFDYTSGPRALQSALTRLERLVLTVRVDGLAGRLAHAPGIEVAGVRAADGGVALSGTVDGAPFTMRLDLAAPGAGDPGDVAVRFREPRVYGLGKRPWDRVGLALAEALPAGLCAAADREGAFLEVLGAVLLPLLSGLGSKAPLRQGVGLSNVEVADGRVTLIFEAGRRDRTGGIPAEAAPPGDPEDEAREALARLSRGADGGAAARLLYCGVAVPRLWPEVLVQARALGEDRPEWVAPQLVGLLLASRMPEIVPADQVAALARRLLNAVEASGDTADLALAGRLAAGVALELPPALALEVADGLRARGVSDPVVLEAAALALDRLGRRDEARAVRARLLALAPAGRTAATLRGVTERLDRAGLSGVAGAWLDEVVERCAEGRYGSEGASIRRQALLLGAARSLLTGDPAGQLRLLDLLREDPADPEALDLLLASARTDREAAAAVARLREAAEQARGPARAALWRAAARGTAGRLGLRRQAVPLWEAALEAEPRDPEAAAALDRLYEALGQDDRRLSLARSRLAVLEDPEARTVAWMDVARLAERAGDPEAAAGALREVLAVEPTYREALAAGARVFVAAGDPEAAAAARGALEDLAARDVPPAGVPSAPVPGTGELDRVLADLVSGAKVADRLPDLARVAGELAADPATARDAAARVARAAAWVRDAHGDAAGAADLLEVARFLDPDLVPPP